jgi:hypothetical protein
MLKINALTELTRPTTGWELPSGVHRLTAITRENGDLLDPLF